MSSEIKKATIILGWTQIDTSWLKNMPNGIEIWNAPRPIYGDQVWTGDFFHGVFYAVIFAKSEHRDMYRQRNIELDARLLEFVDVTDVEAWGREYCQKIGAEYEHFTFDEVARSFLMHRDKP